MDTLALSFFSLVKHNNGYYKSEKQASFLSSKAHPATGQFAAQHGQNMLTIFNLDDQGVLSVEKVTTKKGQRVFTLVFDRNDSSVADSVQAEKDATIAKAQQKRINDAKKAIKERLADRSSYLELKGLYNKVMKEYAAIAGVDYSELDLFVGKVNTKRILELQLTRLDNISSDVIRKYCTDLETFKIKCTRIGDIRKAIESKLANI